MSEKQLRRQQQQPHQLQPTILAIQLLYTNSVRLALKEIHWAPVLVSF